MGALACVGGVGSLALVRTAHARLPGSFSAAFDRSRSHLLPCDSACPRLWVSCASDPLNLD
eukprot:8575558-Pyramimonas_sp.AAC.1